MNKYFFLVFTWFSRVASCIFTGSGMQQPTQAFCDASALPPVFPSYFSIDTALSFITKGKHLRYHLVISVAYNQHIHFIIKGPLGIEMVRGTIDKKRITVVEQWKHLVHEWDYERISAHYLFDCNYLLMQALILGEVCKAGNQKNLSLSHDSSIAGLTYCYNRLGDKVIGLALMNQQAGNHIKIVYQQKMISNIPCLSGINILFSLKNAEWFYKEQVRLNKFRFKQLKSINNKLKIPTYYKRKNLSI